MKMRSKMQNEKGFTLVELMVVVVILGILVAIAVPIYNNVTQKAKENTHDANVRILTGAGSSYYANQDGALSGDVTWKETGGTNEAWKNYLNEWPADPFGRTTGYVVTIKTDGLITVAPGRGNYNS